MPNGKGKAKGNTPQPKTQLTRPQAKAGNKAPAPIAVGSKQLRATFSLQAGPAKYPGSIRVKGCDYLQSVNAAHDTEPGTNLYNFWLTPTAENLSGTRLYKFGQMYDKYLFKSIRFHVLADNPTTIGGSVLSAFDKDVGDETPPADSSGLQQYNSMFDCTRSKVWENHTLDVRITDPQDWYYTNYLAGLGDMRVAYQGQYYLTIMSHISAAVQFQVWIEYDVELYDPQLESSTAEVAMRVSDQTPSTVAGAGFNALVPENVSSTIKVGTDSSGNKYLEVPEGVYALFQQAMQATNSGSIGGPSAYANIASKQPLLTQYTLDVQGAVAGGTAIRNTLLDIPPGGAKIYGNFTSWVSGVIGAYVVRMMKANDSWV